MTGFLYAIMKNTGNLRKYVVYIFCDLFKYYCGYAPSVRYRLLVGRFPNFVHIFVNFFQYSSTSSLYS